MRLLLVLLFPFTLYSQVNWLPPANDAGFTFGVGAGYSHAISSFYKEPSQLNLGFKALSRFNKHIGLGFTGEIFEPPKRNRKPITIDNNGVIFESDSGYGISNLKLDLEISSEEILDNFRPTLQLGVGYSSLGVDSIFKNTISYNIGFVGYFALERSMVSTELSFTRTPFRYRFGDDTNGGLLAFKITYYFCFPFLSWDL